MSITVTHAMILAAGLGTRMRPLTNDLPKPLIQVAGKPLINWCLDWLHAGGVQKVVVNSSYLADKLEAHLAETNVVVSREGAPPLETGGGVKKALPLLGDAPFLTMNSDAILPLHGAHPLQQLEAGWRDDVDFLMLLVHRDQAHGFEGNGDFILNDQGHIRRPQAGEVAPYIFTGIELIHPRAFAKAPDGAFSLSLLWKRGMDAQGWFARVRAVVHDGSWINVGDLAGLKEADALLGANG